MDQWNHHLRILYKNMLKKISSEERIFIAGANGMVGSAIKRILLKNFYKKDFANGNLLTPTKKELNLLDQKNVNKWFMKNKPDIVILAAAKVGGIEANSIYPADFILENIKIQTNVIEASWRSNVRRFLFLGSSCIYPKYSAQPIQEESLLNGELETTNEWYAIAKIAGIKLCQSLRIQYGFDAISLMPTNLYGPNDNYKDNESHVMAALIKRFSEAKDNDLKSVTCWGTGKPFREFMHVDDLGRAAIFVLENWDPNLKRSPKDKFDKPLTFLNVGTGKDISIKKLANLIAKKVDYKGEILWDQEKPDGTPKKLLDIRRINQLGWKAEIELEKGIEMTLKELNNNQKLKYKKII